MRPACVLLLKAGKRLRLKRIDRKLVIRDRDKTENTDALSSKWPRRPKKKKKKKKISVLQPKEPGWDWEEVGNLHKDKTAGLPEGHGVTSSCQ